MKLKGDLNIKDNLSDIEYHNEYSLIKRTPKRFHSIGKIKRNDQGDYILLRTYGRDKVVNLVECLSVFEGMKVKVTITDNKAEQDESHLIEGASFINVD